MDRVPAVAGSGDLGDRLLHRELQGTLPHQPVVITELGADGGLELRANIEHR